MGLDAEAWHGLPARVERAKVLVAVGVASCLAACGSGERPPAPKPMVPLSGTLSVLCSDFTPARAELLPEYKHVNPRIAGPCVRRLLQQDTPGEWSIAEESLSRRLEVPTVEHFESIVPTRVQCAHGGCWGARADPLTKQPEVELSNFGLRAGERRRIAVVLPETRDADPVELFDELVARNRVEFGLRTIDLCLRERATMPERVILSFQALDVIYTIPSIAYFAAFRIEYEKASGEMFMTRTEGPFSVCARKGD